MHDDVPPAEAAEFSRAFDLYLRLDEAKATAARLRAAADVTTGLECEANIRLAEAAEAEVARIEAELRGEGQQSEAAAPERAPAKADQGQEAPAKPKRETQADRVARCLADCEGRAAEAGEPFDRKCMPGTKAEFLDLLHALDAEFWSIKSVESLDRYLSATGCKWPLNASTRPSAAPLYVRLFPKAHIRTPGAVSTQRRKA